MTLLWGWGRTIGKEFSDMLENAAQLLPMQYNVPLPRAGLVTCGIASHDAKLAGCVWAFCSCFPAVVAERGTHPVHAPRTRRLRTARVYYALSRSSMFLPLLGLVK